MSPTPPVKPSCSEKLLLRIGTAVGKYWICKRTPGHAYEAMECIGGSGVMEDCIMPRLYREAPVNAIWEGSGNVQCLDMLRALQHNPGSLDALMAELHPARGADKHLDDSIERLEKALAKQDDIEYRARQITELMALALQGSLLVQYGDSAVAEGFCASRLNPDYRGLVYGTLPAGLDCKAIIERNRPELG